MEKDYKFYWRDGISIESSPPALVLDYSDPDQGGTRLQFRFRIRYSEEIDFTKVVSLEAGYDDERFHKGKDILFSETPEQVTTDALNWLEQQMSITMDSGKKDLTSILLRFRTIIKNGLKNSV